MIRRCAIKDLMWIGLCFLLLVVEWIRIVSIFWAMGLAGDRVLSNAILNSDIVVNGIASIAFLFSIAAPIAIMILVNRISKGNVNYPRKIFSTIAVAIFCILSIFPFGWTIDAISNRAEMAGFIWLFYAQYCLQILISSLILSLVYFLRMRSFK